MHSIPAWAESTVPLAGRVGLCLLALGSACAATGPIAVDHPANPRAEEAPRDAPVVSLAAESPTARERGDEDHDASGGGSMTGMDMRGMHHGGAGAATPTPDADGSSPGAAAGDHGRGDGAAPAGMAPMPGMKRTPWRAAPSAGAGTLCADDRGR